MRKKLTILALVLAGLFASSPAEAQSGLFKGVARGAKATTRVTTRLPAVTVKVPTVITAKGFRSGTTVRPVKPAQRTLRQTTLMALSRVPDSLYTRAQRK